MFSRYNAVDYEDARLAMETLCRFLEGECSVSASWVGENQARKASTGVSDPREYARSQKHSRPRSMGTSHSLDEPHKGAAT